MRSLYVICLVLTFAGSLVAQSALSITSESADLKSSPDENATVLKTISKGEIVDLIRSEFGTSWLYVSHGGIRGWLTRDRVGDGELAEKMLAEINSEIEQRIDGHVVEILEKMGGSSRVRTKPEERKDQRKIAQGDIDGDGDADLAVTYVLSNADGRGRQVIRIAVFERVENTYKLFLDEIYETLNSAGVRIAAIDEFELVIEESGEYRRFGLSDGKLRPVATFEIAGNEELEISDARSTESGVTDSEGISSSNAPPPPPPPPPPVPPRVSKGVVNGSAIELPAPEYPAAAIAVSAQGPVNVAVVIDRDGNVISAVAVSGHPLLRAAAVEAARRARFWPTLLAGVAVEVSGVIIYNFSLPD